LELDTIEENGTSAELDSGELTPSRSFRNRASSSTVLLDYVVHSLSNGAFILSETEKTGVEENQTDQSAMQDLDLCLSFIHWLTHELRNQVNNIVCFLNLAMRTLEVSKETQFISTLSFQAICVVIGFISRT
jgi:hypothetical protein